MIVTRRKATPLNDAKIQLFRLVHVKIQEKDSVYVKIQFNFYVSNIDNQ